MTRLSSERPLPWRLPPESGNQFRDNDTRKNMSLKR